MARPGGSNLVHREEGNVMAKKKDLQAISTINRALGFIEGVASGLEGKFATVLIEAVKELETAVKELVQDA